MSEIMFNINKTNDLIEAFVWFLDIDHIISRHGPHHFKTWTT